MPNWCENTIRVRSLNDNESSDVLQRFVQRIQHPKNRFSFESIIPLLEETFAMIPNAAQVIRDENGLRLARRRVSDDGTVSVEDGAFVERVALNRFGDVEILTDDNEWRFVTSVSRANPFSLCEHWGTKWDAHEATIHAIADGEVKISFLTAWSPPMPIIHALQDLLRPLNLVATMESVESGMGFHVIVDEYGTVVETQFTDEDYQQAED